MIIDFVCRNNISGLLIVIIDFNYFVECVLKKFKDNNIFVIIFDFDLFEDD